MLLLHITLSIIAFDAYTRRSYVLIGYTYVAHAALSFAVRPSIPIFTFLEFFFLIFPNSADFVEPKWRQLRRKCHL
jgi:hypothetical protein